VEHIAAAHVQSEHGATWARNMSKVTDDQGKENMAQEVQHRDWLGTLYSGLWIFGIFATLVLLAFIGWTATP
jgi:hypothetical protein